MKTFDNAWILHALEEQASCFTKRMFGGLAIYLFGRMMMVLVEPTKTGGGTGMASCSAPTASTIPGSSKSSLNWRLTTF